jgi:hypothetical protein
MLNKFKTLLSNKRFLAIAGVLFAVIFVVLFYLGTRQEEAPQITRQVAAPSATPPPAKIVVGEGIFVNNFKATSEKMPGGDDEIYDIIYFDRPDSFLISILSSDFDFAREQAEKVFLEQLGIGEAEACLLNVTVNTPAFINPDLGGQNFGLSFCEDS